MLSNSLKNRIDWARKNKDTKLDLSNCDLTEIPKEVFELDRLLELVLSKNAITTIPSDIIKLHRLRKLYLDDNKALTDLPDNFGELKNLETLDLSYNDLNSIPDSIFKLSELKELYLNNNNQIKEISDKVGNLKHLNYLKINDNQIIEIPKELGQLPNLEKLELYGNKIKIIEQNTFTGTSLTEVNLNNNNIISIQSNAFNSDNLGLIYLEKNDIEKIYPKAFNGKKIFYIQLENNKLTVLPNDLGNLPKLNGLYLGNNLLKTIPDVIASLDKINEINLQDNPFTNPNEKEFSKKFTRKDEIEPLKLYLNQKNKSNLKISDLHQSVYNHLIENYPLLKFKISHQKGRVKKGLYLLGNEDNCIVSLWDLNKKTSEPNIYWEVDMIGNITRVISTQGLDDVTTKLLEALAKTIGYRQEKQDGKKISVFKKQYVYKGHSIISNYRENLNDYIINDINTIDSLGDAINLKEIDEKIFEENTKRITEFGENSPIIKKENSKPAKINLNYLQLQNIGHFKNIQLDLTKQVTCLIGENGSGKTTILRALLLGLIGIDETKEVDTKRPNIQNMLRLEHYECVKQGNILVNYEVNKPYQNQIQFKASNEKNVELEDIYPNDNSNTFGIIEKDDILKKLIIGFSQLQVEQLNKQPQLTVKYDELRPKVNDFVHLIYNEPNNQFENLFHWISRLYNASQNQNNNDEPANAKVAIDLIFQVISKIVGNEVTLDRVGTYVEQIWVKTGEKDVSIPFDLLSQGFKNVFAWVGHFIRRLAETNATKKENGLIDFTTDFANQNAIIVIDEIANYLHPKWQRNILKALVESFPNVQFIVTTHSPLVISNVEEEKMSVYLVDKAEVQQFNNFYGRDIRDVLYEFYGIKARPEKVQADIDRMFRYIQIENIEAAEKLFETLKQHLGEDDGAIVSAETSLELIAAGL
jgi:Leucine-rich repeat (LRR) protein/predicted ATP-binding protein involved in virulence